MKVTIKDSSIVRPLNHTPNRRLWLSNLDLMFPPFYASAAFLYKSDGSPNFMDIKLLKESLSKVLVTFYPLAGKLVVDENGRREVNCNGDGVLLVEAETDFPMNDFDDFVAFKHQLYPAIDPDEHFSSYPLLLLQATKFCCGGVFLSYRIHHNVADAEATTHFFNSWAELTRGQSISLSPVFDRSFLRARHPPNPKFHHVEYDPPPPTEIQNVFEPTASLVKVPIDFINFLKSKVSREDCRVKYSTFEILTAHLWRCNAKARNLHSDQVTTLRIPIDGRNRLTSSLPKGYFGNVIFYAAIEVSTGELLSETLIQTVERVRKGVKQMNSEYMRSVIDYIEKKNNDSNQLLQDTQKYQVLKFRKGTFFVNSWVTLPIFKADFGWGKPINMVTARIGQDMTVLLSCFDGENELPITIGLQEEHKKSFKNLLYVLEGISKI